MDPLEEQNRFRVFFYKFISLFGSPTSPLVLFLDDLQWADTATINLLKTMAQDSELYHFMVVGAYRDRQVTSVHPLHLALQEMEGDDCFGLSVSLYGDTLPVGAADEGSNAPEWEVTTRTTRPARRE